MLDRCLRRGDAVEEQQDLTRFLDVDNIVNRLYDLERVTTANDELYDGYYIDHKGQPTVVFIDDP